MKNILKVFSVMMVVALMVSMMIVPAFAADSTITYYGQEKGFGFEPGSGYTDTDLFDSFKELWPGDSVVEKITFTNESSDTHYVNLYIKAMPHAEGSNDLTYDEAYENADGNDQADVDGERDETVEAMNDFLAQLKLTVWNGANIIFEASPDQSAQMTDWVLLGSFYEGETAELTAQLDIPITLDSTYMNRVGEVDWMFKVELMNLPDKVLTVNKVWKGQAESYPSSVTIILFGNGKEAERVTLNAANKWSYTWDDLDGMTEWSVQEVVPKGYINSIKTSADGTVVTVTNTAALIQTGQLNWPVPVMAALGFILVITGVVLLKKKAHE